MKKFNINPKNKKWPKIILIAVTIVTVILLSTVYAVWKNYDNNLKPVGSSSEIKHITIPLGSSANSIADLLKDNGLIRSDWAFEWFVRRHEVRDQLQAGTYALKSSMGVAEIVKIMVEGRIATDLITILPGQKLDDIRTSLIKSGFDETKVDQALDPSRYGANAALSDKPANANLEGYLYPETFQKTANTIPQEIIRLSLDEMAKRLTADRRQAFARAGLSVHQAITLASIVEHEVSSPNDRKQAAQVFLLRLKQGQPLESDITVPFGDAYNTYKIVGLPPGPISNVTESTLEAVAHPADTDWLYFVAGDDGVTYFSHTFEEHQKLVREHCKKLCGR